MNIGAGAELFSLDASVNANAEAAVQIVGLAKGLCIACLVSPDIACCCS